MAIKLIALDLDGTLLTTQKTIDEETKKRLIKAQEMGISITIATGRDKGGIDLFYGQRYSATVLDDVTDFVKVSEGMGAKAYRVTDIESFEKALMESIELNIPCVIECVIDREDKVFPMVSPGAAISEAFDRQDLDQKQKEQ